MKTKSMILPVLSMILVIAAVIVSVISSNTAYALSHISTLILCGCLAVVVMLAGVVVKLPVTVKDILLLAAVCLISKAMCELIAGRTTLMGYIYFSDLESSNPTAIKAMNLAWVGVGCYLAAIVLNVIRGFQKDTK